jgi:hypothetical protein
VRVSPFLRISCLKPCTKYSRAVTSTRHFRTPSNALTASLAPTLTMKNHPHSPRLLPAPTLWPFTSLSLRIRTPAASKRSSRLLQASTLLLRPTPSFSENACSSKVTSLACSNTCLRIPSST